MPALSLDGHIAGSFTGAASGSVSLTTANSNDVIVVMVGINGFVSPGNSVSSVSAPGLTFSRRTAFTNPDGYIILEIWWAPAASPFNGSITVNLASSSNFTVMAIGVANSPNYTSPWDASSPATGSGAAGTSPSIAYTPTNSNDFIIGFGGTSGTSVDTLSAGPGFTLIDTLSDPLAFPQTLVTIDEYQVVSGTPSSVTVSFNSALSYEWALIGDALNGSAPPASISLSVQFSPAYVAQGQQLIEDIIASVVSGSPGLTTFSISGLPPFTTATFSPPSVTPTALTLLTISTTPNTPLGTYKLIITGTPQNGSPATATLILNVITPVPYQNKCTSYIPTPLTEEREQALRIPGTRALQMPAQKFALPSIDPAIPCSTISPIEKQLDVYVYGSGPLQGVTVRFVIENAPFIVKQTDANGHVFFEHALFISPRTGLPVNSFHLDVLPQDGVHACAWVNANINGPAKLELTLTTNPPPNIALPLTYITDTPNTLFVFNSGQSLCPGAGIILNLLDPTWSSGASLPAPRADTTCALANGIFYVIGGYNPDTSPQNSLFAYDPSSDTWTTLASEPTALFGQLAVATGGKIYAFGGAVSNSTYSNALQIYNISTNSWSTGANLSDNIRGMVGFADQSGLIHVIDGASSISASTVSSHYIYNPSTNSYSTGPSDLVARVFPFGGLSNGIFFIGGGTSGGPLANLTGYDVASNTWANYANCLNSVYGSTREFPAQLNGGLFQAYGFDNTTFYSILNGYDPATNTWFSLTSDSSTYARDGVSGGILNGALYNFGGRNSTAEPIPGLNYNRIAKLSSKVGPVTSKTMSIGSTVLWSDNFEGTNPLANYTAVVGSISAWSIVNVGGSHGNVASDNVNAAWEVITPGTTLQNGTISADVYPNSSGNYYAGLAFRIQDSNNFYFLLFANDSGGYAGSPSGPTIRFYKRQGGTDSYIGGSSTPAFNNTWHNLKVVMNGTSFSVYLDGALQFTLSDSTYTTAGEAGLIGFIAAYFDNFLITSYPGLTVSNLSSGDQVTICSQFTGFDGVVLAQGTVPSGQNYISFPSISNTFNGFVLVVHGGNTYQSQTTTLSPSVNVVFS
jgi:hypothetical protein